MLLRPSLVNLALFMCVAAAAAQAADRDDLLWLEAPKGDRAHVWARDQSLATKDRLSALPIYRGIAAELDTVLKQSTPTPEITLLGSKSVRLLRDAARPHGVLQVARRGADGAMGPWKIVLDVDALREREGKPYELQWYDVRNLCLPPAFDRCLLRLSPGGADDAELREFDLSIGTFVADGFRVPASRVFAVWLDHDHLLIAHSLFGSAKTAAGWPAIGRLWHRGEPLETARSIFEASPTDAIMQLSSLGSGNTRRGILIRVLDYSTFEISLVNAMGKVSAVDLPKALKPFGVLAVTDRDLIVQLSAPATVNGTTLPAETLLAYDTMPRRGSRPIAEVVYLPREGEFLDAAFDGLVATRTGLSFVVNQHLTQRLISAAPAATGWRIRDGLHAPPGTALRLAGGDPVGEDFVLETTGFLIPTKLELMRPNAEPRLIESESPAFDASRLIVEVKSTAAKDGTQIDYYLLRPRNTVAGQPVPTLMTGYGAFGISLPPGYLDFVVGGRAFKLWLDRGGALAMPAIRGGGERGDAWHKAAMREKRQVSYDDFIAVTESLINNGFTTPAKLGVFGSSNGGLLAATMGTERPDLFGAVVSDVPLTDMLRYPQMGMGAAWMDEYGDPKDSKYLPILRSYSPFHNVKEGVKYPPFFITISSQDNRVGPGHARKLAARLEEAGAPVYFFEDEEGGHGVSDALERPDLMALRMTFLIDSLMGAH
jgi:prolyl oligopeptidase